jgi:hypothetical protein
MFTFETDTKIFKNAKINPRKNQQHSGAIFMNGINNVDAGINI